MDFLTLGSNKLLINGVISQLTIEKDLAGQVIYKTSNSSKSSEIGK